MKKPSTFKGINSLFGLELPHSCMDPFLKTIAEPPLDIIRKPDRCSFEESGRGRPGLQSFVFRSLWPLDWYDFEEVRASQQAEMLSAIKLHVTVDVIGGIRV
jgi:hypothetical protein